MSQLARGASVTEPQALIASWLLRGALRKRSCDTVQLRQALLVRESSQLKGAILLRDCQRPEGMYLLGSTFPVLPGPPPDMLRSLVTPF